MHPRLECAMAPVLHDMRATGVPMPSLIDGQAWDSGLGTANAMVWSRNGSGIGVHIDLAASLIEQIGQVTVPLHEWAVEELAATNRTNWPPCPRHPGTHPLEPAEQADGWWWTCPRDAVAVTAVGHLS